MNQTAPVKQDTIQSQLDRMADLLCQLESKVFGPQPEPSMPKDMGLISSEIGMIVSRITRYNERLNSLRLEINLLRD